MGGGHFLFTWRLLLTAKVHYHFWLWKECLIIFLEGASLKVPGCEEGRRVPYSDQTQLAYLEGREMQVKDLF